MKDHPNRIIIRICQAALIGGVMLANTAYMLIYKEHLSNRVSVTDWTSTAQHSHGTLLSSSICLPQHGNIPCSVNCPEC